MARRSRKKRRRRRAAPAEPGGSATRPAAEAPSTPTATDGEKPRRGGHRIWVWALVAAVVMVALVVGLPESDDDSPKATSQTAEPELRIDEPEPEPGDRIVDPQTFRIPESFSAERLRLAGEAIALHRGAIDAYSRGDADAFSKLAAQALEWYEKADWLHRELGGFHILYLSELFRAGRVPDALAAGRRWLDRFPDSTAHLEAVGKLEYLAGDYSSAAAHLEKYAAKIPASLVTQRQLATIYSDQGSKEKGLDCVDRCLELIDFPGGDYWSHPEAADTLQVCMRVSYRFYRYERVPEIAAALLGKNPLDVDALMAHGVAKRHVGDYPGAVVSLRKFLDVAPPDSPNRELVQLEIAIALLKLGRLREALVDLVDLLVENPYLTKGYFQLGQCLSRLGRREAAEAMFARSRELAPSDREVRRELTYRSAGKPFLADRALAVAYRLSGQFGKGAEVLRGSVKRSPTAAARVYLIEYLVEILRIQEAYRPLAELERQVGSKSSDFLGWLAVCRMSEGKSRDAAAILASVCRAERGIETWGRRLSLLYLELDRPKDAKRILEQFLRIGPDPTAQVLLGRALFEAGSHEAAVEELRRVSPAGNAWERRAGGIWLARSRAGLGRELREAGLDLAAVSRRNRTLSIFQLARAEWLEAGGDPKLIEEAGGDATELAAAARREATRLADLEANLRDAEVAAARSNGPEATPHLLEAARTCEAIDRREACVRYARLATVASPRDVEAWKALVGWLDRPEDLFVRLEAQRRLAGLDPTIPAPSADEIVKRLME